MGIFYSPSTGGFYDESIHSQREILTPDPAYEAPPVPLIDDPNYIGEPPAPQIPDPDYVAPEVPLLVTPNPFTKIPADAVAVTDEDYAALFEAQAEGKVIQPGAGGYPEALDPPPPTPEEARAQEIAALEAQQTPERVRQAVLGLDGGWLADLNKKIEALKS